ALKKMEKDDQQCDQMASDECDSDDDSCGQFMRRLFQQQGYFKESFAEHWHPRTTQIVFEKQSGKRVLRLREPRDLYEMSSATSHHLPRWPHECEVIKERIRHLKWVSPVPEPLYKPTGMEKEPACVNTEESTLVYATAEGNKEPGFVCSRVGGTRCPLKQAAIQLTGDDDKTLIFEARFESGNLQKAVKIGEYEYELTLRTDLYTEKHTQWYYFRVSNTQAGVPYRFTIVNLTKPTSLYSQGMRPLMYSEQEAAICGVGWRRVGEQIKYYKNRLETESCQLYSFTWTFQFTYSRDTCYFAHCYPYTYSDLQDYLTNIANDPVKSKRCKIRAMCRSLAGNMVYLLTITSPSQNLEESAQKKAVVLTARVHPGETNSSWMMEGFLDYLLGSSSDARLLRETFIFKVVPMLNPDGVIVGNYRCSLIGRDLNRNYKSILKNSFPSVWYTCNMV
uniref:AGBL carboxypeptidase 3 n=1 Tax=Latimeria chalumnae TaxID=7897 RepID=H2ZTE2_LATCH